MIPLPFKNAHGFSLVEAMVASVIFSIAVVGVFSSLAAIKNPVKNSDKSLAAAFCGQQVLENLRASVSADTWSQGTSKLKIANGMTVTPLPSACSGFTVTYDVTDAGNGARKVQLNVTYPDA